MSFFYPETPTNIWPEMAGLKYVVLLIQGVIFIKVIKANIPTVHIEPVL